jgi:hypothetical protein
MSLSQAERAASVGQFSLEWNALAGGDKTCWNYFYQLSWP